MKIAFTVLALATLTLLMAQKKDNDTTTFNMGEKTIIIISSEDKDVLTHKSCTDSSDKKWPKFIIDIGANGYLNDNNDTQLYTEDELHELNYNRSRSFGVSFLGKGYESKNKHFFISPGIGMTWNNYHFDNSVSISSTNDMTSFSLDTLTNYSKNKLRVSYLEIPLVVGGVIGKGKNPLEIEVGAIGGLMLFSVNKQKYEAAGLNYDVKVKDDYNLNPFKLDALVRVTIGDIGLFARYSFTSLYQKDKAPELYPFALGISFGDF